MTPFAERVLGVVHDVPEGRVTTYGDVAALAGAPRAARGVGSVLNGLDSDTPVPWWRVVGRGGRLTIPAALGRRALQRALLEAEGVQVAPGDRVDLGRFGWDGEDAPYDHTP